MILELDDLHVAYGRRTVLEGLTARLDSRALGLLGPNGAGKSTLIKTLLGFVPIQRGTARLDGLDVARQARRVREQVGYMPEHEAYLAGMSVVRFLRMMGEMCGLPPRAAMERAHEVLFYVGLGEVRYRPIEGFSYGLMQKVRLAQALIHGPRVLILDEPTSGLDPDARREMLALLRDMIARSGSSLIISSHLLHDIESCCTDVLVLHRGRIAAAGNLEAMRGEAADLFELRIKGDPEAFGAALAAVGCRVQTAPRGLIEVRTPDGAAARPIFEVAHRLGIQIRHLRAKRNTLEDVFLKALADDWGDRDGEDNGAAHGRL